ncbi:MAG: class I SAM-dependent methyltransferase [Acidobacteriota bacterium]
MGRPPVAATVRSSADIRAFFDRLAPFFGDFHGPAQKGLKSRLALIRKHAAPEKEQTILEIGCGRGDHLLALLDTRQRGIGIDLSPAMIREARGRALSSPARERVIFLEGNAEDLSCLGDCSVGLAFAVGAFEHMFDKLAVAKSVFRVLRPGGCFLCLSPNGEFLWYTRLAPRLKINTRHLSSDVFLSRSQFGRFFSLAGFSEPEIFYWDFIPRGDVPARWGLFLGGLDLTGKFILPHKLRGGILVRALKPCPGEGGHKDHGDGRGA